MKDTKLLQTIDARVWSEEFNKVLVKLNEQPIDEGLLIAWFANAIMCGWDKAKKEPDNGR